ncbi:MAG: acetyl-CoA carboxylase biotin carboxyl carrier protein [Candidatus Puniceispirillum sp.]|jgi:acetyl-CoA carboxylase biotin carboxyl carrier protein|uniref:acetyl-CoA carboxylase biotin carboxyl carrier protein n=1 Tax=Candidatus Puniceispirillum sp. TaxID=2026719 RepID=UPI001EBAC5DF|nr:acetyl-CoA carboxylase biotin carboxyl carrier protein [Candidatus Puniceispirillum sp.]MBT6415704.1 acetyl-CoA carboxylase biotin carboxyl carrier protein [Candidatus Puniceispirillum sp.]MBT6565333.1 acetyl-CoA carboxylase biotin carboxyl carrier protein [Candidatus Puniceispirillum sp.]
MASAPKSTSSKSETKLVKELADILDASGLAEIEYETEAVSIRLSRVTGVMPVTSVAPPVSAPVAPAATPAAEAPAPANLASHPGAVTSPMVGTVYTSPEPDAPAFISEGDTVKAGQTLFIVEAMKVMNPITAPKAGKISTILVQNAQPVEFGEALVIVE